MTAEQENQLKKDIEACWNEHEKVMSNLKVAFKPEETKKKIVEQVTAAPAQEVERQSDLQEQKKQEEVISTQESESVSINSSEVVETEKSDTQQEDIKPKRQHRSKALQHAELELDVSL